jgi:hypothetical protein
LERVYAVLRRFPAKGKSEQLTVNNGDIAVTLVTNSRGEELTRVLALYKDPLSFRGARYFLRPVYVQGQLDVRTIEYSFGISQIEKLPNQVSASSGVTRRDVLGLAASVVGAGFFLMTQKRKVKKSFLLQRALLNQRPWGGVSMF